MLIYVEFVYRPLVVYRKWSSHCMYLILAADDVSRCVMCARSSEEILTRLSNAITSSIRLSLPDTYVSTQSAGPTGSACAQHYSAVRIPVTYDVCSYRVAQKRRLDVGLLILLKCSLHNFS